MTEIKGICPIIATPFNERGEVDYESLENLVKTLIKGGCGAVTLFGIAGEYYKLSDDEREKMAKVTVKAAKEAGGKTIDKVAYMNHFTPENIAEFRKSGIQIGTKWNNTTSDKTHYNSNGAKQVARMIIDLIKKSDCNLKNYIK